MTLKKIAAAACFSLITATAGHATTFDFFWSADPTADASIVSSDDATMMATGTMDINVANGATFNTGDVSNINIRVSGDTIQNFTVTNPIFVFGSISADGSSATISPDFFLNLNDSRFGCIRLECNNATIFALNNDISPVSTVYSSPAAALASYKLTAQVSAVPLPAGGLLLLSGLAGVAALKRRKNSAA